MRRWNPDPIPNALRLLRSEPWRIPQVLFRLIAWLPGEFAQQALHVLAREKEPYVWVIREVADVRAEGYVLGVFVSEENAVQAVMEQVAEILQHGAGPDEDARFEEFQAEFLADRDNALWNLFQFSGNLISLDRERLQA